MIKVSDFYKEKFGCKVYKISLDAGCTCPNRDGTKGKGGCIFCSASGSGDFVPSRSLSISEQIVEAKKKVESKNKKGLYIAYFQNFSNTYGNVFELSKKWKEALMADEVQGLSVGTRPDCINPEVCTVLKELSKEKFVSVELGLQTSNEETGFFINRKYTNSDFENAVQMLRQCCPEVHLVAHLIFGLPGETEVDMMNSLDFVFKNKIHGIKISVLYVLRGTKLAEYYEKGDFKLLEMEEYFNLLEKALKKMPSDIVVHRLTGDGPKSLLIGPMWTADKKNVLNKLNRLYQDFRNQ